MIFFPLVSLFTYFSEIARKCATFLKKILVELWEYGIQLRFLETFFGEGEQAGKNGLFGPREGEGIGLWDKWRVNVWDGEIKGGGVCGMVG